MHTTTATTYYAPPTTHTTVPGLEYAWGHAWGHGERYHTLVPVPAAPTVPVLSTAWMHPEEADLHGTVDLYASGRMVHTMVCGYKDPEHPWYGGTLRLVLDPGRGWWMDTDAADDEAQEALVDYLWHYAPAGPGDALRAFLR